MLPQTLKKKNVIFIYLILGVKELGFKGILIFNFR